MKRKELTDLRSKTIEELKKLVTERRLETEKAKMAVSGGKEKNLKSFNNLKREVAKILTLIREKEIVESMVPKEEVKEETK